MNGRTYCILALMVSLMQWVLELQEVCFEVSFCKLMSVYCTWCDFCREVTDNKIFYQHPDLMRALCVHETVMNVMVNVLEKHQTSIQLTSDLDAGLSTQGQGGAGAGTTPQNKAQVWKDGWIDGMLDWLLGEWKDGWSTNEKSIVVGVMKG